MVTTTPSVKTVSLDLLKAELEGHDDSVFERMSAHLISRLLDGVAVNVSKSGYQAGGDAGTAGLRGRRLRIECKRYKETTSLRSRELAGEVAEATDEDELLEAWILMATKAVSENERNRALKQGQTTGIAIIVIDWTAPASGLGLCSLAALCATWPEIVEDHLGKKAADASRALTSFVGPAVDNLRLDLQTWNIGYANLREKSHEQLKSMWASRSQSRAYLGQDAAGGESGVRLISRAKPMQALTDWWNSPALFAAPAVLIGMEGVGKTWAALDWARTRSDDLPIVLVVPSGAIAKNFDVSVSGVLKLVASMLEQTTRSTLSEKYWRARVSRLLERPTAVGPSFLLVLDGLNQHPNTDWTKFAQALQSDALRGRIRLLMTCRETYFEQVLRRLSRVEAKPVNVPVSVYDDVEFTEILKLHGMTKDMLHQSLQRLGRTPRLFPLVYRLKDNAALKSDATVHRLLFEYGRDVLEQREGNAFTPDEWARWLTDRAKLYLTRLNDAGTFSKPVPMTELAVSLADPSLTADGIQLRLSELVDGNLFEKKQIGATTQVILRKEAGVLGLALALLEALDGAGGGFNDQITALEEWIEPIGAIEQTAEILRAALSVISAGAGLDGDSKSDCLLVTWMNIQNPNASYDLDVSVFGDSMPRSMLTVVERSSIRARDAVRHLGIQALRKLPRARSDDWQYIEERLQLWAAQVVVPRPENVADEGHYAKRHHAAIIERIGTANPGRKFVLGVPLALDYEHAGELSTAIPGILEGHDLTQFRNLLVTSAVREAAQVGGPGNIWNGFQWLALVGSPNEQDTRTLIAELSAQLLSTPAEPGVHPRLRNHAAALLLRLPGDNVLEARATEVDEPFENNWDYKKDYESAPATSFFELERRHVEAVLATETVPVQKRLNRVEAFVADPTVGLPSSVLDAMKSSLDSQEFDQIHQGDGPTSEELHWEKIGPISARFAPKEFYEASRRKLHALTARRGEQKYWSAIRLAELLLVVKPDEAQRITELRTASSCSAQERIADTFCLQLEILHLTLEEQLEALFNSTEYHATNDMLAVVRPASAEQLSDFLGKHPLSTRAERIVLEILAVQRTTGAEKLCENLLHTLDSENAEVKNISFMALARCAPQLCGQRLLSTNWKVSTADAFEAHYGSEAIAHASMAFDFEDVLPLVAPWRWLDTAVARGSQPSELSAASKVLVSLVFSAVVDLPELPGEISVRNPEDGGLSVLSVSSFQKPAATMDDFFQSAVERAVDANQRLEDLSRNAVESIRKIRASGNSFYLQSVELSAVHAAYASLPAEWQKLLEGAEDRTPDFVKRVQASEGLYMALCEVLLEVEPLKGVVLWNALPTVVKTKFVGSAGVSEFVHMLFRAPDSKEVQILRTSLTTFANTSTDLAIFELVIAAQTNDCDDWLKKLIRDDEASPLWWRRKRGLMLEAFSSYPDSQNLHWRSGTAKSSLAMLDGRMEKWRNRGSLARLWWSKFVNASDSQEAYAAWHVFLSCADRRAYVWMKKEFPKAFTGSELDRLRRMHFRLNRGELERKFTAREEKSPGLSGQLFRQEGPARWLAMNAIVS